MTQLDFGFQKPARQAQVVHLPKHRQTIIPVMQTERSYELLELEVTVAVGVSAPEHTEVTVTNDFEWTDDQVAALHEGLLFRSMELLRDISTTPEDRADILLWVYSPDLLRIEKSRQIRAVEQPFTFARCCALIGADADEIREALPRLLRECGIEVQFI